MKHKNLKISSLTLLLLASFSSISYAAEEISPEKANSLESFKEISVRGTYYSESEYARAISRAADKENADYFYITSVNIHSSNDSLREVYAKLYKHDARTLTDEDLSVKFRQFSGVYEYPKKVAVQFEPYDKINLNGYFPTEIMLNNAIAKQAAKKNAYAFFIENIQVNNGGNRQITAYLFKEDAKKRQIQVENAIPYDSEAGQEALALGGEAAMQVEKPGYYSPSAFNEQFDFDKSKSQREEVKDSQDATVKPKSKVKSNRYTVTLSNGVKIEELNDSTSAKMVPFDTVKFRGYFVTEVEISNKAAKLAADKGAKYYHISRVAQDTSGPNKTVYVDLFR